VNREQRLAKALAVIEHTAMLQEQITNQLHAALDVLGDGISRSTPVNGGIAGRSGHEPPLSRKDTGLALGKHPDTIGDWWDRGLLPFVMIGRRRYTPIEAIKERTEWPQ